jgi:hypothetical protein
MSLHQLRQPVDEILGTGVDTLFYGLASGQTFLHDSQVGAKWGEGVEAHNHGVMWWRASENLNRAVAAGHDPLKAVISRAREKGLQILCSLRMNDPSDETSGNFYMLSRLKREHPEVMIGEADENNPHAATCADFARPEVRQERLSVIEEVCDRYGADGLEMDPYVRVFFKPSEARQNAPVLTDFVREVRDLLDRVGKKRGDTLCLAARVHPAEEANLEVGMDVRTWLSEGLVNLVVPHQQSFLFDGEMQVDWLVDVAKDTGAWVYVPLKGVPYDDRHHKPTIEMFRAAATNYYAMGADGMYLSDLPWPHTGREYQILREMGDPDIFARKAKHYFIAREEAKPEPFAAERCLPVNLVQGVPARVSLLVGDGLETARHDGELDGVTLGVRVVQYCPEDRLSFQFNGEVISPARVSHFYGGIAAYSAARGGLPERIDTHYWFSFDLPLGLMLEGQNELVVTLERHFELLQAVRVLHQAELCIAYKAPFRVTGGQM